MAREIEERGSVVAEAVRIVKRSGCFTGYIHVFRKSSNEGYLIKLNTSCDGSCRHFDGISTIETFKCAGVKLVAQQPGGYTYQ